MLYGSHFELGFAFFHGLYIVALQDIIIIIIIFLLSSFHWRLSDSKSPQVSRNLLSILVDLNNALVWKVSARTPISKSSNSLTILLSHTN